MIHLDYGKNAFTFIRRSDGNAIRMIVSPDAWGEFSPEHQELFKKVRANSATLQERERFQELHRRRAQTIIDQPLEIMFDVMPVSPNIPAKARIHNSVVCSDCGENVMETRSRLFQGSLLCIPCFEKRDRRYLL